ncbi:MAG: hypothetical protein NVS4B9_20550 [Ktedonobacteraceae bacterium]
MPLLGKYGFDIRNRLLPGQLSREYIIKRHLYWREYSRVADRSVVRQVAHRAVLRYNIILKESSFDA